MTERVVRQPKVTMAPMSSTSSSVRSTPRLREKRAFSAKMARMTETSMFAATCAMAYFPSFLLIQWRKLLLRKRKPAASTAMRKNPKKGRAMERETGTTPLRVIPQSRP